MGAQATATVPSCSLGARAAGDDPIGCEITRAHFLVMEVALPWPYEVEHARRLPLEVRAVLDHFEHGSQELYFIGIAPDEEYSIPERTRLLSFRRPNGAFSRFERVEYLAPEDAVPGLVAALCLQPQEAGEYDAFRVAGPPVRDLLICTHGTQDLCCARFGFPAYRTLRREVKPESGVRIWRSSHFGGHRFAPTMLEFPDARGWAWLDEDTARAIVSRSDQLPDLRRHYRGFAGLGFFAQVAEREIFAREGWPWLANRIVATITSGNPGERDIYPVFDDEPPPPVDLRIDYQTPSGHTGAWSATVVPRDQVLTQGECSHGASLTWRFAVTDLAHHPGRLKH